MGGQKKSFEEAASTFQFQTPALTLVLAAALLTMANPYSARRIVSSGIARNLPEPLRIAVGDSLSHRSRQLAESVAPQPRSFDV
jgi:hypothetical protein